MFDPSKFTVAKARPIPLYLLLDTSGSMSDQGKIDELNTAVRTMLAEFEKEQQRETRIDVSVISFGHNGVQLELRNVAAADARASYRDLPADGLTPMGGALRMAKAMIEDKDETPSNAYRPTIVLVSDGEPNDEWEEAMEAFIGSGRSSKCDRMAMAIGASAQRAPLELFLQGTENAVFDASHAAGIHAFFKQVTMSISVRSRAANPNALPPAPPPPELPDNGGSLFF
ncbi:VWA domain-containing protein [Massilia sp. G4R7]|uniref:VWA domain-containing protein n=1 Tax=Massilia phyllostachyos TaxID=2898585 RepID=A0ABS8Q0X5_9BURK|nr:VWA domain-containing protein [Massilia phyllostachyos]MCD2514717.1 VWA domain-containing protein [Massilia phyllostachyos]